VLIDIANIPKSRVLAALFNASFQQGMGLMDTSGRQDMTEEEAEECCAKSLRFDYLRGRVLKVDLRGDKLDPRLYDRDNGQDAAYQAIQKIQGIEKNPCAEIQLTAMLYVIRDSMLGLPVAVFDSESEMVEWLADFDDEPGRFTVSCLPGHSFPLLLLEKDGMLMPTREHWLWKGLTALQDQEVSCRLFRITGRMTEKDMGNAEVYPLDKIKHELPWHELTEEERTWFFKPPMTPDDELKKIAMGLLAGTLFSSDSIREHGNIGLVFMTLAMASPSLLHYAKLHNITFVYEWLSEAGPRSINGMPSFFSHKWLTNEQHKQMYEILDKITLALKAV
jgi:hypothetical protein